MQVHSIIQVELKLRFPRAGGIPGWNDRPGSSRGIYSREKCARACHEAGVNRMLVDQPPNFVQMYANAPNHQPEKCRESLFPRSLDVKGTQRWSGDVATAIDYYLITLAIARESRDKAAEVAAYSSLGNAYRKIANYHKAAEYHSLRLALAQDLADRAEEARAYFSIGLCYYSLERYIKAISVRTVPASTCFQYCNKTQLCCNTCRDSTTTNSNISMLYAMGQS